MSANPGTIRLRTVNLAEAQRCSRLFADLDYTQEPGYALEAAARVGTCAEFVVVEDTGEAVGFASVRIKPIPLLGGGLAYLHGGPATRRTDENFSSAVWEACLGEIARHYARRKLTVRVSAPVEQGASGGLDADYRDLGFKRSANGGRTIALDLSPSLDELRASLAGKWRTDLRRGERGDLRVVRSSAPEDIAQLQPMLADLAAQKRFGLAQDAEFYARAARHAVPDEPPPFVAHLAYAGDRLVGGHIGAFTGDTAVYLLGAVDPVGREERAAFLLQWAVIEHARERGLKRYDLGGIDPDANPDVYRFKGRMGGQEVERPAVWEKPAGVIAPRGIGVVEALRGLRAH